MKQHDLPYHPLYEKGYASIGCNPLSCTRPIQLGEDPRAGRWAGHGQGRVRHQRRPTRSIRRTSNLGAAIRACAYKFRSLVHARFP